MDLNERINRDYDFVCRARFWVEFTKFALILIVIILLGCAGNLIAEMCGW